MTTINPLLALLLGPAATGSQITGVPSIGPAGSLPIMARQPMPPAAAPEPQPAPTSAPRGDVLAVIDPALQQAQQARQQENTGLLAQVMGSMTSGGLTADGVGRSKGSAFAHGLASGLNAGAARRAASAKAAEDRRERERAFGLKEQIARQTAEYQRGRLANQRESIERGGNSFFQRESVRLREQEQKMQELGIVGPPANNMRPQDLERRREEFRRWAAARNGRDPNAPAPEAAPAPQQGAPAAGAARRDPAILDQARAAIARGANPDAVRQRLRERGFSDEGL